MGQKVNPTGFRAGITLELRSRWYRDKKTYGDLVIEDYRIRNHIWTCFPGGGIPRIEIERGRGLVHVLLYTSRPGVVKGRKGAEIERLEDELEDLTGKKVKLDTREVLQPDLEGQLVAQNVADQLSRRTSFRRALKRGVESCMMAGAQGVKIHVAGRLAGGDMSRREKEIRGKLPLQTLDADISYGFAEAPTPYGHIGVKAWVYRGPFGAKKPEEKPRRRFR